MLNRAREDAHRFDRGDDEVVRSVSGPSPCGRKESGNDGRRTRRGGGRDRRGGCGRAGVVESADQGEK